MSFALRRKIRLDHEHIAFVLQGGGALGAYQAGVFEELVALPGEPHWVAGVSIGAINAALIAGNAPQQRLARLAEFWQLVSSGPVRGLPSAALFGDHQRGAFNQWSAAWSASFGVPGFYRPRLPPALFAPDGSPGAISIYDNSDLRATLARLVDFDRINSYDGASRSSELMRLSVGAVNVATGNSIYFDNTKEKIGPEHIMASCALPPAFAPVVIGGESYWDGGIVSNTPLQYVLDERGAGKLMIVQVDLFPARGAIPIDLPGVLQRQKDIMYSSRTRYSTTKVAELQRTRRAMQRLIARLPPKLRDDSDVRALAATLSTAPVDIVHLIYRQSAWESESKDYEFSRASVDEHWAAGRRDMQRTREHPDWLSGANLDEGVRVYDLGQGFEAAPGEALLDTALTKIAATLAPPGHAAPRSAKKSRPNPKSRSPLKT